jgi:response regulator RpfG family c-di-GMP phosphodiesterase
LKIIMFSGRASTDEMSQIMNDGADDFISKPFSVIQLQARVRAALRLKDAQERSETLNERLFAANRQLETNISSRDADFSLARRVMVLALAELVDIRNSRSPPHMTRMQLYCRRLADEAAHTDCFRNLIDDSFIAMLECCVPLRDIGYATLPDHILAKPGSLSLEEQLFIQTHTTMGAEMLQKTARKHGLAGAFVQTAVDIIRHHHERFDGAGYPDRLSGDNIPVSARIVAIADVYDALRSRRCHKPPLSHNSTVAAMLNQCTGQFDPFLLQLFKRCEADFQRIFKDTVE